MKGKSPEKSIKSLSRSPSSKLPPIPLITPLNELNELKEVEIDIKDINLIPSTENPFEELPNQNRRKSQKANKKYLKSLKASKESIMKRNSSFSSNDTKSTVGMIYNTTPKSNKIINLSDYEDNKETDSDISNTNISKSTLVREYTTPSLYLDNQEVFNSSPNQIQVKNSNYNDTTNKEYIEGSSNDIIDDNNNTEILKSNIIIPIAKSKDIDLKESEDVVLFDLQNSTKRNSSLDKSLNLFHRRSSSLTNSLKALRYGGIKRKASTTEHSIPEGKL